MEHRNRNNSYSNSGNSIADMTANGISITGFSAVYGLTTLSSSSQYIDNRTIYISFSLLQSGFVKEYTKVEYVNTFESETSTKGVVNFNGDTVHEFEPVEDYGEQVSSNTKYYPISTWNNSDAPFSIGLYQVLIDDTANYIAARDSNGERQVTVTPLVISESKIKLPGVSVNGNTEEVTVTDYTLTKVYTKQKTKTLRTTTKENGIIVSITYRRI